MIQPPPVKSPFRPDMCLIFIRDACGRYLGSTDWLPFVERYVITHWERGPFLVTCRFGIHPDAAKTALADGREYSLACDRWIYWVNSTDHKLRWRRPEEFPGSLPEWLAGPLRRSAARKMEADFD